MISKFIRITIALLIASSCKYVPDKYEAKRSLSISKIFDPENIEFLRGSSFTDGVLKFKIDTIYKCEISYWSDNPNNTPNSSSPNKIDCPQSDDGKYSIRIENLSVTDTYSFEIYSWRKGFNKMSGLKFLYTENTEEVKKIKIDKIYVMQINNQTKTAKLQKLKLLEKTTLANLDKRLNKSLKEECSLSKLLSSMFFIEDNLEISSVESRGYLNTAEEYNKNESIYIRMKDEDTRQDWTIGLNKDNDSRELILPKPIRITSLSLEQKDLKKFQFLGEIPEQTSRQSAAKIKLEIGDIHSYEVFLSLQINDTNQCFTYRNKSIDLDLKRQNNRVIVTAIQQKIIFNDTIGIPVLYINSDQFITTLIN